MLLLDPDQFQDCVLEQRPDCWTFVLPPGRFDHILDWLGQHRAMAFGLYAPLNRLDSDLDGRDQAYHQLLLWDPVARQLIGGQRLQFFSRDRKPCCSHAATEATSYLEHCYPGFVPIKLAEHGGFAEVGRTFVMPSYRRSHWLRELIRAFVRLPEQLGIHRAYGMLSFDQRSLDPETIATFLGCLESSLFASEESVPVARYPYAAEDMPEQRLAWDGSDLTLLELLLKAQDPQFALPGVLRPYRTLCSVEYMGVSEAKSYNQIIQLLFSGSSNRITRQQRRRLPDYPMMLDA
jgi:hypothetical protein